MVSLRAPLVAVLALLVACAAAPAAEAIRPSDVSSAMERGKDAIVDLWRKKWAFGLYHPGDASRFSVGKGTLEGRKVPDLVGLAPLEDPDPATEEAFRAHQAITALEREMQQKSAAKVYEAQRSKATWLTRKTRRALGGTQWCFKQGQSINIWRDESAARAATAAHLAVSAYRIGKDADENPLRVGSKLAVDGRTFSVVFVDLNGRKSRFLGAYTGPFFAAVSGDEMWVVVRGSATATDWMKDLTDVWAKVEFVRSTGQKVPVANFHRGFAEVWQQYGFTKTITRLLGQHPAVKKVRFAGHSLGGALAQLLALEYHVRHGGLMPECYTIGSPRVGGDLARVWLHEHVTHYRFKNENDVVPSVPTFSASCMLSMATHTSGLNPKCKARFYHAADVSVRLLHTNMDGAREVAPVCISEDNDHMGYNPVDHGSAHYAEKLFDLAIRHSQKRGGRVFNGGVNPYRSK